jgi:hypothetical protein
MNPIRDQFFLALRRCVGQGFVRTRICAIIDTELFFYTLEREKQFMEREKQFMDKNITRRAVLGTAVAGLAVAPFVVRALRRGNVGGEAHATWKNSWSKMLDQMVPQIASCDWHEPFQCRLDPKIGQTGSMSILTSADDSFSDYQGGSGAIPNLYGMSDFEFAVQANGGSEDNVVLGRHKESRVFDPMNNRLVSSDVLTDWAFLVRDNGLVSAEMRDGRYSPCSELDNTIKMMMFFGAQMTLGVGMPLRDFYVGDEYPIKIPTPDLILCPTNRRIAAMVKIDDVPCVKICTDSQMENESVLGFLRSLEQRLTDVTHKEAKEGIREQIKEGIDKQLSVSLRSETYYRLSDGMLVFRKERRVVHDHKNAKDESTVTYVRSVLS